MKTERISYSKMMESAADMMGKHKILFLPNILMILISVFLLYVVYNVSGLQDLLTLKPYILNDKLVLGEELSQLFTTGKFAFSVVFWFVAEILIGAYFVVMKYGMIRDVILNGKTSLHSGVKFAKSNYLKYWGVHILAYLLIYGPLFILFMLYFMFIKYNVASIAFTVVITAIFGIITFVYLFLIMIRIFYLYPVMTFEKDSVFKTFDEDFHYVKTHMGHTFLSLLIFLAVFIGWVFLRDRIEIFSASVQSSLLLTGIALLMVVLEIIVSTWEHLFIFKSYEEGKKLKKTISKFKAKKKTGNKKKKAR